ncbi:TIGR01906 family membrane protein [Liquorilactobacillus vini]|uniref:Intergral membrane protein n=1 Tax=Liquorilactobacillus vini DSM 20605 TaxID=1133569 RepID=A0A0R2CG94_9LACO|nr:TIGR01906 family membrane protein [Liquorilactobacillus vini]KRM87014.1 intergral membrane protein [Liquorilactobacillus vini DSM 20605]
MKLSVWLEWLPVICLMVFFLSCCIVLTLNFTPIYYYFVYHYHLGAKVDLSNRQLITQYHQLLAYLNFPWVTDLKLKLKMSTDGLIHFQDVKKLVLINYLCLLISGWPAIKKLRQIQRLDSWWQLYLPSCYLLAAAAIILTFAVLDFSDFFIAFHQLLFRNQDWIFDPQTDPIIKVLPESFFAAMFGWFAILFFGGLLSCFIITRNKLLKNK